MRHAFLLRHPAAAFAALAVLAACFLARPVPAPAQTGLPHIVMIGTYKVPPEHHDGFRAWIAEFRALVEKQIEAGLLSQTDICAYRSWRVLGPDAAGLNQNFMFVFEPVIPIANYSLQHYVDQALDDEAAAEMMARFHALTANAESSIVYASPLDPAVDAIDLGEVCAF